MEDNKAFYTQHDCSNTDETTVTVAVCARRLLRSKPDGVRVLSKWAQATIPNLEGLIN